MKVVASHDIIGKPESDQPRSCGSCGLSCGKGDVRRSLPRGLRWQSRCVRRLTSRPIGQNPVGSSTSVRNSRRILTGAYFGCWGEHLSVDVLAPGSMKTVAKHDNQWKLQKQETHQVVERICERVSALLMGC